MKIIEYNLYRLLSDDDCYHGIVEFDLGENTVLRKRVEGTSFEDVKYKIDECIKNAE